MEVPGQGRRGGFVVVVVINCAQRVLRSRGDVAGVAAPGLTSCPTRRRRRVSDSSPRVVDGVRSNDGYLGAASCREVIVGLTLLCSVALPVEEARQACHDSEGGGHSLRSVLFDLLRGLDPVSNLHLPS